MIWVSIKLRVRISLVKWIPDSGTHNFADRRIVCYLSHSWISTPSCFSTHSIIPIGTDKAGFLPLCVSIIIVNSPDLVRLNHETIACPRYFLGFLLLLLLESFHICHADPNALPFLLLSHCNIMNLGSCCYTPRCGRTLVSLMSILQKCTRILNLIWPYIDRVSLIQIIEL